MRLKELYQKVQMKKNLEIKLNELVSQRNELNNKEYELKKRMISEQNDVDRLEQGGISSFLYELMGRKEEKLEQERQEAHEAKSKYNTVVFQLMYIEKEISRYEAQLRELAGCEEEYQRLMEIRLEQMKQTNPEIIVLEQRIIESQSDQKEILEAKIAAKAALDKANEAKSSIDSAGGWSTFDLLGGGAVADMMKYAKLNEAERRIQELQVLLGRLKTELADVQVDVDVQVKVGDFLMMADFFFDNLFTDYAVRSKISNAKAQLEQVMDQIRDVICQMDDLMTREQKNEKELKIRMEQIASGVNA